MKYDKNAPSQILELVDPGIDKIEILKKNFSGDINFTYNVVIFSQYGNQVFVRADRSIPTIELVIVPLMDNMIITSSFGKPNTKMDISLMKQGFEYNNKIWYPTADRDAVILCVPDKIMPYNVRYVNKKITPAQKK